MMDSQRPLSSHTSSFEPSFLQDMGRGFNEDLTSGAAQTGAANGSLHGIKLSQLHPSSVQANGHIEYIGSNGEKTNESSPPSSRHSIDEDDPRRAVNRVLEWYHIFFIALSGTIGAGVFISAGEILRLAGPAALISSLAIVSILAWMVMQCIGEMLSIWPISGALNRFVEMFVDEELGIAVGVAYWFTNAMCFLVILIGLTEEMQYWSNNAYVQGIVLLSVLPSIILLVNFFGVKPYAWIEVIGGVLKSAFAYIIIIAVLAIICGAGKPQDSVSQKWHPGHYDKDAAPNHAIAFIMCLRLAAFDFVGIEMTAATALEAKTDITRSNRRPIASIKVPATMLPAFLGVTYTIGAIMIALNVDSTSCSLPSQVSDSTSCNVSISTMTGKFSSSSVFVQAAEASGISGLATTFTVFMLFSAITSLNTQLYVGSRTLFGLADKYRRHWIGYFGITSPKRRVPIRAIVASAVFWFIGYFRFIKSDSGIQNLNTFFNIVSNMAAVSCITVWACECLAFLRFYYCLSRHRDELNNETRLPSPFRRFVFTGPDVNYPWRSHMQPATGIIAFVGCIVILTVVNSAPLWSKFQWQIFLSSFLAPFCFFTLVLGLKFHRYGFSHWIWGVNLLDYENGLFPILKKLEEVSGKPFLASVRVEDC
ncbi:hypothetical protein N431DRAFT_175642 [Stipitochalara longipes BDJ]|nr:hypothetical protein N431DRAFT_175642 [Stipitochalara longipes BDJ]